MFHTMIFSGDLSVLVCVCETDKRSDEFVQRLINTKNMLSF